MRERDDYSMFNHEDAQRDRQHPSSHQSHDPHHRDQPYHSPQHTNHQHDASSAKPNNAFFNLSPSNLSPVQHDERRQQMSHNDAYQNRKQRSPTTKASQQKPYHPSKHNGSSHHPDR